MKKTLYPFLIVFVCSDNLVAQDVSKTFEIPEAGIAFDLTEGWEFFGRSGDLEQGKVQYSYSYKQVPGFDRMVNPSIIITADKASWFKDEEDYLEDKLRFYELMGDSVQRTYAAGDKNNPLAIRAYYSEGLSAVASHPYGQQFLLITVLTEKAGLHMQIQTSQKELETNKDQYSAILKSIRIQP